MIAGLRPFHGEARERGGFFVVRRKFESPGECVPAWPFLALFGLACDGPGPWSMRYAMRSDGDLDSSSVVVCRG